MVSPVISRGYNDVRILGNGHTLHLFFYLVVRQCASSMARRHFASLYSLDRHVSLHTSMASGEMKITSYFAALFFYLVVRQCASSMARRNLASLYILDRHVSLHTSMASGVMKITSRGLVNYF